MNQLVNNITMLREELENMLDIDNIYNDDRILKISHELDILIYEYHMRRRE